MIRGAHFLLYSKQPDADRAFLRDVLGFRGVDAGGGWMIHALPPAEIAVHPDDANFVHEQGGVFGGVLWLMCDDVGAEVGSLRARGVECAVIGEAPWGRYTTIGMPSGGRLGLYQPSHKTAIG